MSESLIESLNRSVAEAMLDKQIMDNVHSKYDDMRCKDIPRYIMDAIMDYSNRQRLTGTQRKKLSKFVVLSSLCRI